MSCLHRHFGRGFLLVLAVGALVGCPFISDVSVVLSVAPVKLDFGALNDTLTLEITKNATSEPMPPVRVTSTNAWVIVETCQSAADNCVSTGPNDMIRVPVRVDRSHMALGPNTGSILVEGTGLSVRLVEVTATNLMVADFAVGNRRPEVGQEVQFTDHTVLLTEAGAITSMVWDFGDGTPTATESDPRHVYEQAGIYTVSLTVTAEKQVATRVRSQYVSVSANPPEACLSLSPSIVFVNDTVRFTDCSLEGGGATTGWLWDFGDGQTSTEQNPTHAYVSPGLYAVSLTVTNALGEDTSTQADAVLVQAKAGPTAKFRVVTSPPLVNSPVEFRDSSIPGTSPITRYAWSFGDGGTAAVANPTHTYRQPGTYVVTLTVETAHGSDTSDGVPISPETMAPAADFVAEMQRALTIDAVQFKDTSEPGTSPITSWQWDFGDDSGSSEAHPTHRYSEPGTYTVTLTVTTGIGSDAETKTDYVGVFEPTPLDTYVRTPDTAYGYRIDRTLEGAGYTAHVLQMTSQTWRTSSEVDKTEWQHWLTIIEPDTVSTDTAMLFISGGNTSSGAPSLSEGELQSLATMAVESQSVVAQLKQVPNEPLTFAEESFSRTEDAIIAYSFAKYLETGDETWPALFPMVKSAVRAMDTVQSFHAAKSGPEKSVSIERFVVSGASKRGWTTWLTAATDTRVTGIVPMVFDVLNMADQMAHQFDTYGYYSEAVYDYVAMNIFDRFDTPEGQTLLRMVDPYEYRDRLTMPKLLINSTGDEFFLPDSAQFYFQDLPGENHLAYLPNTSHSLADEQAVVATFLPWYRALVDGLDTPGFSWTIVEGEGRIIVETDETPLEVNLWTSVSLNRDFRLHPTLNPEMPGWFMTSVPSSGSNRYAAQAPSSDTGWTAFFVQVKYSSPFIYAWYPAPYTFTSEVRVIPDTSPTPPTELPVADFTGSPLEPQLGGEVSFADSSTYETRPIIAWFWNFGDGATDYEQNPAHVYSTLSSFDVSLTVYTVLGFDTMTKPAYVTVQGAAIKPTAAFSATPRIGYQPMAVQFTDQSVGGSEPITGWLWDFGDAGASALRNPAHSYVEAGAYNVSLTVTNAVGSDTRAAPAYIVVNAAATADFTADNTFPATFEPVHFQDLSVGLGSPLRTWYWDFGDGVTSTEQSPVHAYTTLGAYTVTLTVATDYGGDTIAKPNFITVSTSSPSALEEYAAAYDAHYSYAVQGQPQRVDTSFGSFTVHLLNMTSQQWRTEAEVDLPIWRHWVTIIEPLVLVNDTALLFITGGDNTDGPPSPDELLYALAGATGSVVVELRGVPSEPLRFTDETRERDEDEIIAYTFDKYMKSVAAGDPDPTWPLLLPMAKSAVRAMDTAQDYLAARHQPGVVNRFVVSGASKRGWTTWLTAIADPQRRVAGIIPLVIDVLNIDKQMAHHRAVYGYWSPAIYDYAQMRVFERMGTAEGDALLSIVDPYRRRDKLAIPKLLVNSTGDQFFVSDSAQFYFDNLPAPKYLNYIPNTDHGLNTEPSTIGSIASFFLSVAKGLSRPQVSWSFDGANTINVHTVSPPAQAYLWQVHIEPSATGGRRDFRLETIGPAWQRTLLTAPAGAPGQYAGRVTVPATGWTAFFVQLVYSEGYVFTTDIRVVPDTYPEFRSYRTSVGTGADTVPVCVLYGEPYEMGRDLGTLMRTEIQELVPSFLELAQSSDPTYFSNASLDAAWATTSPYMDQRYKDELQGVASGSGVRLDTLRRLHMIPLLDTYSCSSVAAWGNATADGHLLQTRDLDWTLDTGAQEFPCLAMYIPDSGTPHVNVTFAGYIGCQAGMNLGGIALAEMGDSPDRDKPYDLTGNHFTAICREMLYDAMSLTEAINILAGSERIKKYHYVIGDGRNELSAVKIRAHEPEPLEIWRDNDRTDPNAVGNGGDGVAVDVVYNDEGRGAWPFIYANYGRLDVDMMINIANSIPIRGSNVIDVVYDATDARLWVSYAEGYTEAYERPYVEFDMQDYLP